VCFIGSGPAPQPRGVQGRSKLFRTSTVSIRNRFGSFLVVCVGQIGRGRVRKWPKYLVCLRPLWVYYHWFRACTSAQRGPEPVKIVQNIDSINKEQVWTIFSGLCRSKSVGAGSGSGLSTSCACGHCGCVFHWFRACTSAQRGPGPVKTIPNIDGINKEQVWTVFSGLCR